MKQHLKPTWKQIALCVLFGLAAVLGVYVETLFLLLPAVFGFVWAAWGGICCAVSLGTAAAVLLVCFGSTQTLYALALFAPASLCVGCCLRFKKPYRTAAVSAAAAIAAGYYCLLCLPSLLAGEGPFAAMEETLLTLADAMESLGRESAQAGFDAARFEFAQPGEDRVAREVVILAEFVDRGYPVPLLELPFGDAVDDEVDDLFVFRFVVFHGFAHAMSCKYT